MNLDSLGASDSVALGLAGMPSAIDIEKIVESRAFEIGAMQTAMKTARLDLLKPKTSAVSLSTIVLAQPRGYGRHSQGIYEGERRAMTSGEFPRG